MADVHLRIKNGYVNTPPEPPEKSTASIFADNIFTYFNLIFVILGIAVASMRSWRDLTFLPVVIINAAIGIIQELRSRATLRKMQFITATSATVIREGREEKISPSETVVDDIAVFSPGAQIYADATVVSGSCRVNEALVTGESDEVEKAPGANLLSGSFIVSGSVKARLDKVGRDSFVAKLTIEAKKTGRHIRSEMMHALTRLVKVMGIIIIPIGAMMIFESLKWIGASVTEAVLTTTAAIIGMIPEGLYLLVSIALTVSVMRLAKKRVLVHDMRCIESLARVDVLCVDKTGTITEPAMDVKDVVILSDGETAESVSLIMRNYLSGGDTNETSDALRQYFTGRAEQTASRRLAFSSANKYAGAEFPSGESFYLGAPDKLLNAQSEHAKTAVDYAAQGYRVLLLSRISGALSEKADTDKLKPIALILLTHRIRESAVPTFEFFAKQGVSIRVISGDNPATVSRIAIDAGIQNAERFIDASTLKTERNIRKAAKEFTVFGRVTPDMKRKLIRAMRAEGHTVAMTGDGVNDVLALKDADVGIAMASGSEAASQVAELVLVDSNFAAMTNVVSEGRRVINNIERSSSLYLMKNSFSLIVALFALVMVERFPLSPSQLTLYNAVFIGIPSFVLALQPNRTRVRGRFIVSVLLRALPAGLTDFFAWLAINAIAAKLSYSTEVAASMTSITMSFIAFVMLFRLCLPLNKLRIALLIAMPVLYVLGSLLPFLRDVFAVASMTVRQLLITGGLCLAAAPICAGLMWIAGKILLQHRASASNSGVYHKRKLT